MKKLMKRLAGNEGFTLVELMIVLSIIAILAVVLVPKVGSMKDSVREQGVVSNANSVRAYLELKVNGRSAVAATEATRLRGLMNGEFTSGNAITNPFTNGTIITDGWTGANLDTATNSVCIFGYNSALPATFPAAPAGYNSRVTIGQRGKVFVMVFTDAYVIWGLDKTGTAMSYQVVK